MLADYSIPRVEEKGGDEKKEGKEKNGEHVCVHVRARVGRGG